MPMLLFIIIIGAAAGFLATRMMRVETDVPTTIVIGIVGAVIGWALLRFLVAITGFVAMFIGAVLGAMLLIWAWRTYISR
ncbi:MAG: GlsB/YeaQ/YmgE family stress response membrane protein [Pseudorhodobacter sp.]|nr:GlsB/YeaQ/YmgE family stress response membrane protein [Pseudorhodobacter sp.]